MNGPEFPGIELFNEALARMGREAEAFTKTVAQHPSVDQARKAQLHAAAVKRRRKRKKGGHK